VTDFPWLTTLAAVPLVGAVAVAALPMTCTRSSCSTVFACRQAILPVARSTAMVSSVLLLPSTAVRKIRSRQTAGELCPVGSAVFQS